MRKMIVIKQLIKDKIMLVYDYVELKEDLFEYIISGKLPYKVDSSYGHVKSFYNVFGQTVVKICTDSSDSYQYFISSAYPV